MNSIKEFIKETKKIIKKDRIKINDLHRQINEYNGIIEIMSQSEGFSIVEHYKEKRDNCYMQLDEALDSLQRNKNIIATMLAANEIIKRGEKCA